jgi:cysteinyl-tRNA synthetase
MDEVLGLYEEVIQNDIPEEIKKLANEREEARERKDYKKADQIRSEIEKRGYTIEDTESGHNIVQLKR